jgi:hypothetical protein
MKLLRVYLLILHKKDVAHVLLKGRELHDTTMREPSWHRIQTTKAVINEQTKATK